MKKSKEERPCTSYEELGSSGMVPIKAWTRGVPVDDKSLDQLKNAAKLPIVYPHLAVMPDVHWGIGATIGSVIPTRRAIIPAAVGVDIGCGMIAVQTTLRSHDLPDSLEEMRSKIEAAVPHGKGAKATDKGAWYEIPRPQQKAWSKLFPRFEQICARHPLIGERVNHVNHLGTLGGGNHFIEVCLDTDQGVWLVLHSGSRGVGNRIGSYFIETAKREMERHLKNLPDRNLAYFEEGNPSFQDYVDAVGWAQDYARINRELMMKSVISALERTRKIPPFKANLQAINCHHNYVCKEEHFGEMLWVTRKGALRAGKGDLGIIPGSMGDKSFIVRGKGNPASLSSCSHGAGRVFSRSEAKKRFELEDHLRATAGVECRKDLKVLDETPGAYKSIEKVMEAQQDLVEIVHTLKQVVCVKG